MVRLKPKDTKLIAKLKELGKPYFTVADLEKILGLKRKSLYVALNRLVQSGLLVRLRRNIYTLFTEDIDYEKIANELYFPSYLSFETALTRYGIFSQIPYTISFATTRSSRKITLGEVEVEYRHLKQDLFFGYNLEHGKYIATPEKALLDEVYFVSRGKVKVNLDELDLSEVDENLLEEYAKEYPNYTKNLLGKVGK